MLSDRPSPQQTRRELLLAGGGLAMAMGACGVGAASASAHARRALAVARARTTARPRFPSDRRLLAHLLAVEQAAAYAYRRALGAAELDPTATDLARQVLACERAHARALSARLRALGVRPGAAVASADAAERVLAAGHVRARFDARRSPRGWLGLLLDVEAMLERNYHTALIELSSPALAELCAQIYANEAQHSALLAVLLHPRTPAAVVGAAFVNGT